MGIGSRMGTGALEVVYAETDLLVLNKPSGLLSVPGRGEDKQDCLSARAQAQFPGALIVHRLDMATSGLMVMARSPDVQRSLSNAFANREVTKHYVAVVDGLLEPAGQEWQIIDLPINVDWPNRPLRMIDPFNGKPSVTRWQPLQGADAAPGDTNFDRSQPFTRVLLAPVTGRSHQLRVHLAALGHPILGDALYAPPAVQQRVSRLLLHASLLGFANPRTGVALKFTLAVPF
jgi:tRNA pseudouridine32 synthase/23S rRNA pseudouridine746 synthase